MPRTAELAEWPGDDPAAIALASRIAMFDGARLFPSNDPPEEEKLLLDLIELSTKASLVEGLSYPDFLVKAKDVLSRHLSDYPHVANTLRRAVDGIASTRAVDHVGNIFREMRQRIADDHGRDDLANLPLERSVVRSRRDGLHVTGMVPGSRSRVMVNLSPDLDHWSFAVIPIVLAHELVCHATARDTGGYRADDDVHPRAFFTDGFMDVASSTALYSWLETGEVKGLLPVSHIAASHYRYRNHGGRAPDAAFTAGHAAWKTCRVALGHRLRGQPHENDVAGPQGKMLATAFQLNGSDHDVRSKDRWVDRVVRGDSRAVSTFTDLATGNGTPSPVFEQEEGA